MASILPRVAPRAFSSISRSSLRGILRIQPGFTQESTPSLRRFLATPAEQPRLRLGSTGIMFFCVTPI